MAAATDNQVWIDEQGFEWTLDEWADHAAEHGITWHLRLDGQAIVEGEAWGGGQVLLGAADTVPAGRVEEIVAAIRQADADRAQCDGYDPLSDMFSRLPWPEVDHQATDGLADPYAVQLVDGTVISWDGAAWVATRKGV